MSEPSIADTKVPSEMPELTFGEKAVGLKFNHAEGTTKDTVHELKVRYAQIIDMHNEAIAAEQNQEHVDGEVIRLHKVAITELQGTQMWSVKAATWERNQ